MKVRTMRWMALQGVVQVVMAVLGGCTVLLAQHGADRGLTRQERTPAADEAARMGILKGRAVPADTVRKASWLITPLGKWSDGVRENGLLVGLTNESRFGSTAWDLDVRAFRHTEPAITQNRFVVTGTIYPHLPDLAGIKLEPLLSSQFTRVSQSERTEELSAEVDAGVIPDALLLGGIVYYDLNQSDGLATRHGAYEGVTVTGKKWGFSLVGEYDFGAHITDEKNAYSVVLKRPVLTIGEDEVTLRTSWEKGNAFSVRLQLGIPANVSGHAEARR